MNRLTFEFHNNNFPGLKIPHTLSDTMQNFWNCDLPFLELPVVFDVDSTKKICLATSQWKRVASQDFFEERSKKMGEHWFFNQHSHGWEEIRVIGCPELKKDQQYYKGIEFSPNIIPDLLEQFQSEGMHFEFLSIKKLKPHGWLQPHKDHIHNNMQKFNYFWMPLNDSSENLKIWPHGYVKHKTGKIYLFNNTGYVHSVLNRENFDRYVLLGRFDLKKTKFGFDLTEQARDQWYR